MELEYHNLSNTFFMLAAANTQSQFYFGLFLFHVGVRIFSFTDPYTVFAYVGLPFIVRLGLLFYVIVLYFFFLFFLEF